MKRRNVAFDPDLAEGSLEIVEFAYASVPSYDGGWESIHPSDQAEWLGSFEIVRMHLDQLARWEADHQLDAAQVERYAHLIRQQQVVEAVIARLQSSSEPPAPARGRAAALLSMVLGD